MIKRILRLVLCFIPVFGSAVPLCPEEAWRAPAIEVFRDMLIDVRSRDRPSASYDQAVARARSEKQAEAPETSRIIIENTHNSVWSVAENRDRRPGHGINMYREDGRNCMSDLWQAHISRGFGGVYVCDGREHPGFLLVREALDDYLATFGDELEILSISWNIYGSNLALVFSSGDRVAYYLFNRCGGLVARKIFDGHDDLEYANEKAQAGLKFSIGHKGEELIEVNAYNAADGDLVIINSPFHGADQKYACIGDEKYCDLRMERFEFGEEQRLVIKERGAKYFLLRSANHYLKSSDPICLQWNGALVYAELAVDGAISRIRRIRAARHCFQARSQGPAESPGEGRGPQAD